MTRYILIGGKRYEIEFDSSVGGDYTIGPEASLPQDAIISGYPELVSVDKEMYSGNQSNLTINEVFTQLQITCEQDEIDTVISSPLDDSDTFSPFTAPQKYATELISFGEGDTALKAFISLLKTGNTDYEKGWSVDHFFQAYKSKNWTFNGDKYISSDNRNQWEILQKARGGTCTAFLGAFGKSDKINKKDNSVQPKPDMTKYLCVAINGNRIDTSTYAYPTEDDIREASPIAEYTANCGGFLAPIDDETTNYLVFSGKMILVSSMQHGIAMKNTATINSSIIDISWDEYGEEIKTYAPDPQAGKCMDYPQLLSYAENESYSGFAQKFKYQTIKLNNEENSDGAYYVTKFYENEFPYSKDVVRTDINKESLYPYNSDHKSLQELSYDYSEAWDSTDKLSKLKVLCCQLSVGSGDDKKYCVEISDEWGNSTFKWLTEDKCPRVYVDGEEYIEKYIYIGINPKIGDSFIGNSFDITNTVGSDINIDAKGMAIPIRKQDQLNGRIEFQILGPMNTLYEKVCRHHPSFWKHTRWWTETKSVLSHCNMLLISDFECKIYTDNANINNVEGDSDLIYQSDENPDFTNLKDDISFKIVTALTTQEAKEKGLRNTIKINNPWIKNEPLRSVYNTITKNTGKPEEHYLTNAYTEYSTPKMILETEFFTDQEHDWLTHYKFDTLPGREFMIQSITSDVKNVSDKLVLKQINDIIDSSVPVEPEPIEPEPQEIPESPVISFEENIMTITCATPGADIYWGFDTAPDSCMEDALESMYYSEPVDLTGYTYAFTIVAQARKNGVWSYKTDVYFDPRPANPMVTIADTLPYEITLSCDTEGATIYYRYFPYDDAVPIFDVNDLEILHEGSYVGLAISDYTVVAIAEKDGIYSDYVVRSSNSDNNYEKPYYE